MVENGPLWQDRGMPAPHPAPRDVRASMERRGVEPVAIDVFERQIETVGAGASSTISDAQIEPYDSPALPDPEATGGTGTDDAARLDETAVIRLNGGLGTSMGMDRAKSLLPVRGDRSFLDIIVGQMRALRSTTGARLPLTLMHSFRTSQDSLALLDRLDESGVGDVPIELMQNMVPKLLADSMAPVEWPAEPDLEWCPPGHGDLYTVLYGTGFLDRLADAGYRRVFVANSDNLGALPSARMAAWFAGTGAPFAIEAVRRTDNDRKGGHFARRNDDGRLILRETAQTPPDEVGDIERHRFTSTNNLWFDVEAMRSVLSEQKGDMHLPVIVNAKTVDPTDPSSPAVVQLETAMGAAIEVFDEATTVEVGRDRFVPVKTTDDLLIVRSDCYRLADGDEVVQTVDTLPYVSLSKHYKLIDDFDARFPAGPPSLAAATSLRVEGDWTFGGGVTVIGDVVLGPEGGDVPDGATLGG